ncbi:GNAT family N-acetyltransferase [Halobium salinum]|uniref:GNAT family N-acetyltransferase n=1 Tax=Halobium salinum TaxID=1364940 RepID=A0ABD5PEX3_9EURY|nr:GNAT family N-acetyltransferase [Halobium salinum]
MEVSPAVTDDADRVVDLWVDLAEGQRAHGSHLLADANREAIRESVLQHVVTGGLLVARESADARDDSGDDPGPIAGFVMFGPELDGYRQDVNRGVVRNIFVAAEHRGRGVGSDLLAAAERDLEASGVDVVSLEVLARNADARRFYEARGYATHRVELEKRVSSENDTDSREG